MYLVDRKSFTFLQNAGGQSKGPYPEDSLLQVHDSCIEYLSTVQGRNSPTLGYWLIISSLLGSLSSIFSFLELHTVSLQSRITDLLLLLRYSKPHERVGGGSKHSINSWPLSHGPLWTLQRGRWKRATCRLWVPERRNRDRPNANPNLYFKKRPGRENAQKSPSVQKAVKRV